MTVIHVENVRVASSRQTDQGLWPSLSRVSCQQAGQGSAGTPGRDEKESCLPRSYMDAPKHFLATLLTTTLSVLPALPPCASLSPSLAFVLSSMKGGSSILKSHNVGSHTKPSQQVYFEGSTYCFVLFGFCI